MTTLRTPEIVERLNADGHVVIENLIPKSMVADLRDRVERILERERAASRPIPGDSDVSVDQAAEVDFSLWRTRRRRGLRASSAASVTGRPRSSTRPGRCRAEGGLHQLHPHPVIVRRRPLAADLQPHQQGRRLRPARRAPAGAVGDGAGARPRPDRARHERQPRRPEHQQRRVARRLPTDPDRRAAAELHAEHPDRLDARRLHGPTTARPTWRRAATTPSASRRAVKRRSATRPCSRARPDRWRCGCRRPGIATAPTSPTRPRNGVIVQYGRSWVKPFVDLRTPIDAAQAAAFSPRLRYMLGCNANAPVRGRAELDQPPAGDQTCTGPACCEPAQSAIDEGRRQPGLVVVVPAHAVAALVEVGVGVDVPATAEPHPDATPHVARPRRCRCARRC